MKTMLYRDTGKDSKATTKDGSWEVIAMGVDPIMRLLIIIFDRF